MDSTLLMHDRIESGLAAFVECHQAKVSSAMDILQASFSSDLNAMMNFGEDKVLTQLLSHEATLTSQEDTKVTSRSAAEIKEALTRSKSMEKAGASAKAKSTDKAEASGEQKQKVQVDDDGFRMPQGMAHHNQKKLEAHKHRKIVERILKRDLDPLDYLIDIVKLRHKLSPYGLSNQVWRAYLLYLANTDPKKSTLPQVARKLVNELKCKITKVELILDRKKDPLSAKVMKEAKLYLSRSKQDWFKIKFLVDCFPVYSDKWVRDKSVSSDSATESKGEDRRASRSCSVETGEAKTDRRHSSSKQHDRELKASLAVDSQ